MALAFWIGVLEGLLRIRGIRRRTHTLGDGRTVSYMEAGRPDADRTLVLVHGLGSSNLTWVRVMRGLARRHRVIALDLPGYGKSPATDRVADATLPGLVAALEDFLQSPIFSHPVTLVGQSMGGWVVIRAALRRPDRIEQLVLVNTAGIYRGGIEGLRAVLHPKSRDEVHAFWKLIWYRTPWFYKPFWRAAAVHMQSASVHRFIDNLGEADFVNKDLPKLEVPVNVIWGRTDKLMHIETVDDIVRAAGSARVYWIAKCGHIPPLEAPTTFVRLLEAITGSAPEDRPLRPTEAQSHLAVVARE